MATNPPPEERLDSWKAIAAYLDRQVRTVQRWEKEEGLPVHRLPHKKQGSVYAYKSELDAWRQRSLAVVEASLTVAEPASPTPDDPFAPSPHVMRLPLWSFVVVAALALAAAGGWWWVRGRSVVPVRAPAASEAPGAASGRLLAQATGEGGAPRLVKLGPAPQAAVLSGDGGTLYVADAQDGSLSEVDTASLRVRAVLRLGGALGALALSGDGRRLYAAHGNDSRLEVVDLPGGAVRSLTTNGVITDLALSPDGGTLYLALQYAGLDALDTATLSFHHISGPACPSYLAMGPDGKQLYIVYQCGGWGGRSGHDAIGIWDVGRRELVGRLVGPPQVGSALAIPRDGSELWAGMGDACNAPGYDHRGCAPGQVSGINIYSLGEQRPVRNLALRSSPQHITFLNGDTRVAVVGGGLSIYDATRMAELEHQDLSTLGNLVMSADGARAFLPLTAAHALAVFDASTGDCAPPSAELLGWWRGDGTAADAWGLNQGHWLAAAAYAPGQVGQALRFTGANAVSVGHDSTLLSGMSVAVAFWLKPEAAGQAALIAKYNPASGRGWQVESRNDGGLEFCAGSGRPGACGAEAGTRLVAPGALTRGRWVHVAVAAANGRVVIYVDGRVAADAAMNLRHLEDVPTGMVLGGPGWRGLMDEAVYYSHLTAAGVAKLVAMRGCVAAGK